MKEGGGREVGEDSVSRQDLEAGAAGAAFKYRLVAPLHLDNTNQHSRRLSASSKPHRLRMRAAGEAKRKITERKTGVERAKGRGER